MINPSISVVMPVCNGQDYVAEAVESVLNQTFKDFEFIIIDDGSTDETAKIIEKYKIIDDRIVLIKRENRGLAASLNEGIKCSKGKYVARMDADDISVDRRFEEQVNYLENNKEVSVVGCDFYLIDRKGKVVGKQLVPKTDEEVFFSIFYTVPFAHPSIMGRTSFFINNTYEENGELSVIEDYSLWINSYEIGVYKNLPLCLFKYRIYQKSFSASKKFSMYLATCKLASVFFINNKDKFFDLISSCDDSIYKYQACAMVSLVGNGDRVRLLRSFPSDVNFFIRFFICLTRLVRKGFYSFCYELRYRVSDIL